MCARRERQSERVGERERRFRKDTIRNIVCGVVVVGGGAAVV